MKIKSLFVLCVSLILISCGKDDDMTVSDYDNNIAASWNERPVFDAKGGVETFSFMASADWNAEVKYDNEADGDWLAIAPCNGGAGDYEMQITALPNGTYHERYASINFTSGAFNRQLIVKQNGIYEGDVKAFAGFDAIALGAGGDEFSIKVYGYEGYTVECNDDWCNVEKNDNNGLTIKAAANPGATRATDVKLISKSGRLLRSIYVKQLSVSETTSERSEVATTTGRSSLFLVFTATWCPYSPMMDNAINMVLRSWSRNIEVVKVHVVDSELYYDGSRDLSEYYSNNTTPTCILDGRVKVESVMNAEVVSQAILNALKVGETYYTEGSQIKCETCVSGNEVSATVSLNGLDAGDYRLHVWLLEDDVLAGQEDALTGMFIEDYVHDNVLVESMSAVTGDEFSTEVAGNYKELMYKCTVPDYCNMSNLRVLTVLQRKADIDGISFCFPYYVDNCVSVGVQGSDTGGGYTENIMQGEDIELN